MNITPAEEDYLLATSKFEETIRTSEVAKLMNVSDPSASTMLDKLAFKGMLKRIDNKRKYVLTEEGSNLIQKLLRRHRLIERFLVDILGYTWDEVHDEANRIEHYVSDMFVNRIQTLLGDPEFDPHGSVIPNENVVIPERNIIRLASAQEGDKGIIAEVNDHEPEMLRYFATLGLHLNTYLEVTKVDAYGGSVHLLINEEQISLSQTAATNIWIIPN